VIRVPYHVVKKLAALFYKPQVRVSQGWGVLATHRQVAKLHRLRLSFEKMGVALRWNACLNYCRRL
jgi:hypothetical protein